MFERLFRLALPEPKIIRECEGDAPMLERFTLVRTPWGSLRLHHFVRGDDDRATHDHPWSYLTFVLAGGYVEIRPSRSVRALVSIGSALSTSRLIEATLERFRVRPGMLLYRPAWWIHRIELAPGRDAWTLIWMSKKSREWGFFTPTGWLHWRQYYRVAGCSGAES